MTNIKKLQKLETKEEFDSMKEQIRFIMNLEELDEELFLKLESLKENGFYSPVSNEAFDTIPMSERWYTKYELTYHVSVLLLKYYLNGHEEVYGSLVETIHACLSKGYKGRSYDVHSTCINVLTKLYKAGIKQVFNKEESIKEKFELIVSEYRKKLGIGNTREGFGDLKESIIKLIKIVDKDNLFVYGTLMENERNAHYLNQCEKICDCEIYGYDIVNAGGYPGIIPTDGIVEGELYEINDEIKSSIDLLEGSQYKYESDFVFVNDYVYYAHFYEYILQENIEYYPCVRKNNRWIDTSKYVWYACYGSNLLEERFDEYISRTTSKEDPIASKSISLPYELYFAKNSTRWNYEGVAFLDINKSSETLGWMYLITKEQFNEIHRMEGSWYSQRVYIDTDEYGIDILTFTSPYRYDEVKPSQKYLNVIKKGLKEKYELSEEMIQNYIKMINLFENAE